MQLKIVAGIVAAFIAMWGAVPASAAGQSAMDRAIGQCMVSVGVSTIAGALIGGMAGNNAGRGAAIGAAAGVGSCAVLMQLAAAEDKRRIAAAERQAVLANANQVQNFRTKSGKPAQVTTRVRPAPKPAAVTTSAAPTECRYAEQTVTVENASVAADRQLWCRSPSGEWAIEKI